MRSSSSSTSLLLLFLGLLVLPGGASGASDSATEANYALLQELRATLAQRPQDLDTRLRLATVLSWVGERKEARQQANQVIAQAPRYWDAHILIARLDGWDKRYAQARKRLQRVLEAQPENMSARLLLVDIERWAQRPERAERLLKELLVRERSAQVYARLASVAMQQLNHWRAFRYCQEALKLDPVDKDALQLKDNLRLVSADLAYQAELISGGQLEQGHSELLTVAVLPRSFLSVVLLHELHYRFGTLNNRLLLQADWRITRRTTLTALGGFGLPAHVIPRGTGSLRVAQELLSFWDVAIGYTYDYLPAPGHLHRIRLDNGFRLPYHLRLEAAYIGGALVQGQVDDLHGMQLRAYWAPQWIEIYLQYAYGMELYSPTGGYSLWYPFKNLSAHTIGFQVMGDLSKRLTLRGGYDLQLRSNETISHLFHLAVRVWF